ncbi:ketopantoate reductase family protein [Oscillibacter sp.]|uniref:ketopantoate reductase family protein n=1 Tax=Oscillibacter sp. TaxID=1945593 RepID=UPI00262FCF1F|nr:ketopantoate reductase family protein [Oscillibacter sp.]MDD3346862.1 ketopantoate reductase family protein [Oscillibacter sp.]
MNDIKTVGIVGLGALGTMYAALLTKALGKERVLVLADSARTRRYREEGVWYNGERCDLNYTDATAVTAPVDFLMFTVKYTGLADAIETCRHLVGPDTTLISILNGISSEEMLIDAFGADKVVWCVVGKVAAQKEGNHVTMFPVVPPAGEMDLGVPAGQDTTHLRRLTAFFDSIGFRYLLPEDIRLKMWSKLLCNVGCNQAATVYQCNYSVLQSPGPARDTMIAAMREVVTIANAEGISLSEGDVEEWTAVIDGVTPTNEPSMRQDGKAHRKSEVELFSGTVRRIAAKHHIPVPVNEWLYQQVQELERSY